MITAEG